MGKWHIKPAQGRVFQSDPLPFFVPLLDPFSLRFEVQKRVEGIGLNGHRCGMAAAAGGISDPQVTGPMLGAAIALFGTVVALGVDAYHRSKERRLNLRREAYLKLSEAVTIPLRLFSRCTGAKFDVVEESAKCIDAIAEFNKVHAVGELSTIGALLEMEKCLARALHELHAARLEIDELLDRAAVIEKTWDYQLKYKEETLKAITAVHAQPQSPETHAALETHDRIFEFLSQSMMEQQKQEAELREEAYSKQLALGVQSIKWGTEYSKFLLRLNTAIRKEVGFEVDAKRYEKMAFEYWAAMDEESKRHLDAYGVKAREILKQRHEQAASREITPIPSKPTKMS